MKHLKWFVVAAVALILIYFVYNYYETKNFALLQNNTGDTDNQYNFYNQINQVGYLTTPLPAIAPIPSNQQKAIVPLSAVKGLVASGWSVITAHLTAAQLQTALSDDTVTNSNAAAAWVKGQDYKFASIADAPLAGGSGTGGSSVSVSSIVSSAESIIGSIGSLL